MSKRRSGLADRPFFAQSSAEKPPTKQRAEASAPRRQGRGRPSEEGAVVIPGSEEGIQAIRRAVATLGKEGATHRFTVAEKRAIADVIFAYKRQGINLSENVITRIAINYIIQDYRANGEKSVLANVIDRLNP